MYTPREDPGYDRVGSASWYGELFHGRRTANGEIYDMDRLSAAHPTLPLPVYARVTNLNNGRSLVVRINDRGPFARDRIIDLSRRSAELLGFRNHGTATVRVKYLRRAPLSGDDSYEQHYVASQSWARVAAKGKTRKVASSNIAGKERLPAENPENLALAVVRGPATARRSPAASGHGRHTAQCQDKGAGRGACRPGRHVQERGQCRPRAGGAFSHRPRGSRAPRSLLLRPRRTFFRPDRGQGGLGPGDEGRLPRRQGGEAELASSGFGFRVDFYARALDIRWVRPPAAVVIIHLVQARSARVRLAP